MKKYLTTLLAACCMLAAFSMPASALEYHFDGPDAGLFGRPTSDDTIYVTMDKPANTDRSKNAAYIPPAFGSPTSYTLNAGGAADAKLCERFSRGNDQRHRRCDRSASRCFRQCQRQHRLLHAGEVHCGHERPLLQRRLSRYAENPHPRSVCQGVSGNGRGRASQRAQAILPAPPFGEGNVAIAGVRPDRA